MGILFGGLAIVFALLGIASVFVGEWRCALGFGLLVVLAIVLWNAVED